jgi:hypothetical protein
MCQDYFEIIDGYTVKLAVSVFEMQISPRDNIMHVCSTIPAGSHTRIVSCLTSVDRTYSCKGTMTIEVDDMERLLAKRRL